MKPHEAYDSLKKKKKLINTILLIILGLQVLFSFLLDVNIPIPSVASKIFASIISDENPILIENLEYRFPNKFRANKINFSSTKNNGFQVDNAEIELDLMKIFFDKLHLIRKLNIDLT